MARYDTIRYYIITIEWPTWHDMTWHDTTWHDTTRHDTTWHDMTWHDTIWYHKFDMICNMSCQKKSVFNGIQIIPIGLLVPVHQPREQILRRHNDDPWSSKTSSFENFLLQLWTSHLRGVWFSYYAPPGSPSTSGYLRLSNHLWCREMCPNQPHHPPKKSHSTLSEGKSVSSVVKDEYVMPLWLDTRSWSLQLLNIKRKLCKYQLAPSIKATKNPVQLKQHPNVCTFFQT